MWYVVKGAEDAKYLYDQDEFLALQWFALDDIPFDESAPHMRRFIDKMSKIGVFDAAVI